MWNSSIGDDKRIEQARQARAYQDRQEALTSQERRELAEFLDSAREARQSQSQQSARLIEAQRSSSQQTARLVDAKNADSRWRDTWVRTQSETAKRDYAELSRDQIQAKQDVHDRHQVHAARQHTLAGRATTVPAGEGVTPTPLSATIEPPVLVSGVLGSFLPSSTSPVVAPSSLPASPKFEQPIKEGVSKAATPAPSDGTKAAMKEVESPMAAFYSTQHDATSDHKNRWGNRNSNDSLEELLMSGQHTHVRQSAIVGGKIEDTEYQQTTVRETVMPKLYELTTRLAAMGQGWARVVIPVDAQTKIIVRFNSQSGRVKLHLSTPSDGLADMIRTGWNWLTGEAAKTGITVDEPTFDKNIYDN